MPPTRPRFAVDEMLGSLARWLRIMGYDASYERDLPDAEILVRAMGAERILLTRDQELAARAAPASLLVESEDLDEQLRQVVQAFGLRADESMARCTVCNGELRGIPAEEAREKVPEGTFENNHEFYMCTRCGKIYWKGAHWKNIRERLGELP